MHILNFVSLCLFDSLFIRVQHRLGKRTARHGPRRVCASLGKRWPGQCASRDTRQHGSGARLLQGLARLAQTHRASVSPHREDVRLADVHSRAALYVARHRHTAPLFAHALVQQLLGRRQPLGISLSHSHVARVHGTAHVARKCARPRHQHHTQFVHVHVSAIQRGDAPRAQLEFMRVLALQVLLALWHIQGQVGRRHRFQDAHHR